MEKSGLKCVKYRDTIMAQGALSDEQFGMKRDANFPP